MPRYYLDIETAPLEWNPEMPNNKDIIADPTKNKIITIQYQQIGFTTGKPTDELTILKEWESSEEDIVMKFSKEFLPFDDVHKNLDVWAFVPVGLNLNFEWQHLTPKLEKYCGIKFDPLNKPAVDLKDTLILINDGAFTGYSKLLRKNGRAYNMAKWYHTKDYNSILDYIIAETEAFHDVHQIIGHNLPLLKQIIEQEGNLSRDTHDLR